MKVSVAYCHVVASVLAADGMMDDKERRFLAEIMDKLGLAAEERDAVTHFEGSEDAQQIVGELPETARRKLLDDVLGAVLADGKITNPEQRLVEQITTILGL